MPFRKTLSLWLVLGLAAYLPAHAATIKKKNDEVVEGSIQGYVVQRCNVTGNRRKAPSGGPTALGGFGWMEFKTKPGSEDILLQWDDIYRVTQGPHVQSVDETGIQAPREKSVYFKVLEEKPAHPETFLLALRDWIDKGLPAETGRTAAFNKEGIVVMAFSGDPSKLDQTTCLLLGEFQALKEGGLIEPALRIETESGMTLIPVTEIVPPSKKQR